METSNSTQMYGADSEALLREQKLVEALLGGHIRGSEHLTSQQLQEVAAEFQTAQSQACGRIALVKEVSLSVVTTAA